MDNKYKYTYEKTADYKKLKDMFKNNSHDISIEEKLESINIYCSDESRQIIEN